MREVSGMMHTPTPASTRPMPAWIVPTSSQALTGTSCARRNAAMVPCRPTSPRRARNRISGWSRRLWTDTRRLRASGCPLGRARTKPSSKMGSVAISGCRTVGR
ncbi:Uncharacterised protein [Bordetella pertussis]|nr:Uncharacterised protein [Bordetella pertussis]